MTLAQNKAVLLDPAQLGQQLVRLTRPQNVVYPGLLASLTSYYFYPSVSTAVLCYLYFISIYSVAVIYNNIIDRITDHHNKRTDNPLVNGQLRISFVKAFLCINLAIFALIQFGLKQPASIVLGILYLALAFSYSSPKFSIQSRGWWSPLLLAICYGSIPLLLGISQSALAWNPNFIFLLILQVLLLYPILLAKDYKDLKGDKLTGKLTPLVRYGEVTVRKIAFVTAIIAAAICFLLNSDLKLLPLIAVYIIFVIYTHNAKGRPHWLLQKTGMIGLLAISIILLQNI